MFYNLYRNVMGQRNKFPYTYINYINYTMGGKKKKGKGSQPSKQSKPVEASADTPDIEEDITDLQLDDEEDLEEVKIKSDNSGGDRSTALEDPSLTSVDISETITSLDLPEEEKKMSRKEMKKLKKKVSIQISIIIINYHLN